MSREDSLFDIAKASQHSDASQDIGFGVDGPGTAAMLEDLAKRIRDGKVFPNRVYFEAEATLQDFPIRTLHFRFHEARGK